jgi:predicted DNA-binding transcriptional regulator YafY
MNSTLFLDILFTLLAKKTVTSKYLANRFEVSSRTIFRYIDTLSVSGVPLWITRGKNGGISIPDTFKLPSGFLNKAELESTLLAINTINNQVPNVALQKAALKLSSQLKNVNEGKYTYGNIIFDCGSWGNPDAFKNKLSALENALSKNYVTEIEYHDRGGEVSRRKVEPHLLIFKQGVWYLFAHCRMRKDYRFFKVSRIRYAQISEEKFIKKDLSNYELPFNNWYNSDNIKKIEIKFKIEKSALSDAEEWLGIENIINKDENFYAVVKLPDENSLIPKILSFGKGLKVISPQSFKYKIKEYLLILSSIY